MVYFLHNSSSDIYRVLLFQDINDLTTFNQGENNTQIYRILEPLEAFLKCTSVPVGILEIGYHGSNDLLAIF